MNSEFSYESKYKEDKKMIMSNVMVKPNTSKACELGRKSENKKPRNFEALNVKEIKSKDKSVSNSFIGMKTTIETMKKLLK